jgi:uncharacterized membrane protein
MVMGNATEFAADQESRSEWVLKRNCALTPKQLMKIFASLALASLGMAGFWASQGAWLVLPFAVIEVLALGVAFAVYARHAADCERVRLDQNALVIERMVGERQTSVQLSRAWLRVRQEADGLVEISSGQSVESVGRFVDTKCRQQFALGLRQALRA